MISNSAAGVLAHLVAEDAALWTVQSPTRDAVRMRLRETVNTWDLETRRNVRYRCERAHKRLPTDCSHFANNGWKEKNAISIFSSSNVSLELFL